MRFLSCKIRFSSTVGFFFFLADHFKVFPLLRFLYVGATVPLTLKTPRKPTSENVVCFCRLLNILANFSNMLFAYRRTVWTQIRLLLIWVHTVCNNDF